MKSCSHKKKIVSLQAMQRMPFWRTLGLASLLAIVLITEGCRKDPVFNTDPNFRLEFSSDTIAFDTVFTTMGSTTFWLKVYNRSSRDVEIQSLELVGGEGSPFRLNVDGDTSLWQENIRLRARDSLFVFIKVTIAPNDSNNPIVVTDYIRFSYNNRTQDVVLQAFGQDIIPHRPKYGDILEILRGNDTLRLPYSIADCSVPWKAGRPHVIYGYLLVQSGDELILEEGTRVHFAPDAGLIVADGASLKVRGSFTNEVIFDGMRMDAAYRNTTGQWNRIWLLAGSVDNEIDWAIIRNGRIGLLVDSVANHNPTLVIENTIIDNMQSHGILAQGAVIRGGNLQVSNCGDRLLALMGGDYVFEHCTFANYFSQSTAVRRNASVLLSNTARPLIHADFTSCIIYGSLQEELHLDLTSENTANYSFSHCLIRTPINTSGRPFHNCRINTNPHFKDPSNGDFEI
ncbi:MAG: DUF5123 domain-containing protein, partial [Bacteroidales bacterium]|nr:DUF5123 domain-containing protein [Bacteroidales bacterium]